MSFVATLVQAANSYRNAAIQCIVNKADPYNAITFYRNMLAMLPPEYQKTIHLPEEPKFLREFTNDPDMSLEQEKVWIYVREYSYIVEQALARYASENMAALKL